MKLILISRKNLIIAVFCYIVYFHTWYLINTYVPSDAYAIRVIDIIISWFFMIYAGHLLFSGQTFKILRYGDISK